VDGRVVSNDLVRGDLRSPRTTSLDTMNLIEAPNMEYIKHSNECYTTVCGI
jgi:hypothetical protein